MYRLNFWISAGLLLTSMPAQAGSLQFEFAEYAALENSTSVELTISRSGLDTDAASVTVVSADGSAVAEADFNSVSTTVNWAAGDSLDKTVSLTLLDDALEEGDETLQLSLTDVTGDTLGALSTAVITVQDYEEGQLSFSQSDYQITEDAGVVKITISRNGGDRGELSAEYSSLDDSAKLEEDYAATNGSVTLLEGETSGTFQIPIRDDAIAEIEQSFLLQLTATASNVVDPEGSSASVTILDDDSDFTSVMQLLSVSKDNIIQVDAIDMSQVSLYDSASSLMDSVNQIPVLDITETAASQNADGIVDISVGDGKFLVRPLRAVRADVGFKQVIVVNPDSSGYFITAEGLKILFQPALAAVDVLQSELAQLNAPELEINQFGNITIQVDQGPPPLELNEEGEVVVNNSYYDRFNIRPQIVSNLTAETETGIYYLDHPENSGELMLMVVYNQDGQMRQQLLSPAAIIATELINEIEQFDVASGLDVSVNGIISFRVDGQGHRLFPDYIVRRVENFSSSMVGLKEIPDINGDGVPDFNMIYSNGDQQNLVYLPPQ